MIKNQLSGNEIFIPGEVRSSKNSKVWTGKYLVNSKAAARYIVQTAPFWNLYRSRFLALIDNKSYPLIIRFTFIRGTKQKFDYHNMVQLPLDLMQKHYWIEDDCANIVLPVFLPYQYDKENPGLIISI